MRSLKPCGTWAAYQRHIQHREPICDACQAACNRKSAAAWQAWLRKRETWTKAQ